MSDAPITRSEIFYLNRRDGWTLLFLDAEGNQVGDAQCAFHQRTLIGIARQEQPMKPIQLYRKDGSQSREIV